MRQPCVDPGLFGQKYSSRDYRYLSDYEMIVMKKLVCY